MKLYPLGHEHWDVMHGEKTDSPTDPATKPKWNFNASRALPVLKKLVNGSMLVCQCQDMGYISSSYLY